MVEPLLEFVQSVWIWWYFILASVILVVSEVARVMVTNFNISRRTFITIVLFAFIPATFMAFRDMRAERDELKADIVNVDKVSFGIEYAINLNYQDATHDQGNTWRDIVEPIEDDFESGEKDFFFGIQNKNDLISMLGVKLTIYFPKGLLVKRSEGWERMHKDEEYFRYFGMIVAGDKGQAGLLRVKFPNPGNYKIRYKILADHMYKIEKTFEVRLR